MRQKTSVMGTNALRFFEHKKRSLKSIMTRKYGFIMSDDSVNMIKARTYTQSTLKLLHIDNK